MIQSFHPDFELECRLCGTSPCVIVVNHVQSQTNLCGCCFFNDRSMLDWEEWNNSTEEIQDDTDECL